MMMKQDQQHILILRDMLAILMERQSNLELTSTQQTKCVKGIAALNRAVETLETQHYA